MSYVYRRPWDYAVHQRRPRLQASRPRALSATVASDGFTVSVLFSEVVTIGAGGNGGMSFAMSGGTTSGTYSSGDGSNTLVYTAARGIGSGETGTAVYSQPTNGIEDLSGNDVTSFFGVSVTNNSTLNAFTLAAESGSFALTGTAVALNHGWYMTGGSGTYSLNANDVNFVTDGYLAAESGTFTLSGTAASLLHGAYFLAEMGVIQMDADDVTFSTGIRMAADSGSYTLTGTAATFLRSYVALSGESGSFVISGTDVDLFRNALLTGSSGTYTITGAEVTLSYSGGVYAMSAESGSFTLTGTAITFLYGPRLNAESGTFTLTGADVTLRYSEEGLVVVSIKGDVGKRLSRVGGKRGFQIRR